MNIEHDVPIMLNVYVHGNIKNSFLREFHIHKETKYPPPPTRTRSTYICSSLYKMTMDISRYQQLISIDV